MNAIRECRSRLAAVVAVVIPLFAGMIFAETWDTTRFEYDRGTGLLARKIYPDGKAITYTYHYRDLPKRITLASGKWMERFYDERLHAVSNVYSSANTPDVYLHSNEFGTLDRVGDSNGLVYEYGISLQNQRATNETVTSPWMNWTLGHAYDQVSRDAGWSLAVDGTEKGALSVRYDRWGMIAGLTCVNSSGRTISVCYTNSFGRMYGCSAVTSSGMAFRQEVTRDPYRRELVTRLRNTVSGQCVFDCAYAYDACGRLIVRTDQNSTSTDRYSYYRTGNLAAADIAGISYAFGYDGIGNCRWSSVGVTTNYYQYNDLNQCLAKIRTGVDVCEHTFDDDGNLTQVADGESYDWDCENRLIVIETSKGCVTNCYDYEGRLVRQLLPDAVRTCVFDDWNLIYEKIEHYGGTILERQYFWGPDRSGTLNQACGVGGLVSVSINGAFYFPCYGSNSEITAYVSESGAVVASYVYGPFGEVNLFTGVMSDQFAFRFMTKRYDTAIGLYDFGTRWYSPALHRWLNRDSLGEDGGLNLYVFCENNPVSKYDPDGCIPLETVWDLGNVVYDICVGDDVALATDIAALALPYVPAGASKMVKAASLSNIRKICPGVKKIEITYEYLPVRAYKDGRHTLPKSVGDIPKWWKRTQGVESKFLPGWGDFEVKGLIKEAFAAAKRQGKFKPRDLDGFVYDAGRTVGATNGKITTKIKIHVNPDGKNLHAFPVP